MVSAERVADGEESAYLLSQGILDGGRLAVVVVPKACSPDCLGYCSVKTGECLQYVKFQVCIFIYF